MKKILLSCFCLLCQSVQLLFAQDKSESDFTFYYVSHDRQTNVQSLSQELQRAFDDLKEYNNAGIFYLANGEEPVIVKVNLPDENEKDFPHLIGEMQERLAHNISAGFDVDNILSIFEKSDFIDEQGALRYNSVNWNFYVTSSFWAMGYNESVIGTLFWTLDMGELRANKEFYLNVLRSSSEDFKYNVLQPIGIKNYNGINDMFAIGMY